MNGRNIENGEGHDLIEKDLNETSVFVQIYTFYPHLDENRVFFVQIYIFYLHLDDIWVIRGHFCKTQGEIATFVGEIGVKTCRCYHPQVALLLSYNIKSI